MWINCLQNTALQTRLMGWTAPAPRHRCATTWSSVNATTERSRPPCKRSQSVPISPSTGFRFAGSTLPERSSSSGTYGTSASLATCGENNLNGNAPFGQTPNGICQTNGIGSLVKGFRVGTQSSPWTFTSGSPYDDGADPNGGGFDRSSGFTCNIVAAKVVQCVKGPLWTSGVPSLNSWTAGSTWIAYGDATLATTRVSGLEGYPGGQSLTTIGSGFTAGSGYTPGSYNVTAAGKVITTPSYNATTGILPTTRPPAS
jgi:hypothetical protein